LAPSETIKGNFTRDGGEFVESTSPSACTKSFSEAHRLSASFVGFSFFTFTFPRFPSFILMKRPMDPARLPFQLFGITRQPSTVNHALIYMPKPASRFWVDILITSTACGLALLIATLGAAAGTVAQDPSPSADVPSAQQTYEGMITDTKCSAKHKASIAKSAADCVRVCVHGGEKFAIVVGEQTYVLDGDLALLKKSAGQRASVVGTLNGNTITVSSVVSGE
jgi:hypothetical protein